MSSAAPAHAGLEATDKPPNAIATPTIACRRVGSLVSAAKLVRLFIVVLPHSCFEPPPHKKMPDWKGRMCPSNFQPRKQALGFSAIDGLPVVFREAGVLDQPFIRQLVISDGRVAAVHDLRDWNDVFQCVECGRAACVRCVEI